MENRAVDEREGYRRFGLPLKQEKLASEIKAGDLLITYIASGLSMISDVRRATSDGVSKLASAGDYLRNGFWPLRALASPGIVGGQSCGRRISGNERLRCDPRHPYVLSDARLDMAQICFRRA